MTTLIKLRFDFLHYVCPMRSGMIFASVVNFTMIFITGFNLEESLDIEAAKRNFFINFFSICKGINSRFLLIERRNLKGRSGYTF